MMDFRIAATKAFNKRLKKIILFAVSSNSVVSNITNKVKYFHSNYESTRLFFFFGKKKFYILFAVDAQQ